MTGFEPAIFRFEAERVIQLRHMDDLKSLAYTTIFEQQQRTFILAPFLCCAERMHGEINQKGIPRYVEGQPLGIDIK